MKTMIEQELWSEKDLMKMLNITFENLKRLRVKKGLPYVRVGNKARVYVAGDVLEFFRKESGGSATSGE